MGQEDNSLGGTGAYNLSGGQLIVSLNEHIGMDSSSTGTFNQSGGAHEVKQNLYVDVQALSKGLSII